MTGPANDHADAIRPPRRPPGAGRTTQPPLTPMIDVTFQLLLFFLLAFTFRQAEGLIPGVLPGKGKPPPEVLLRITLRPTGPERTSVVYEVDRCPHLIRTARELGEVLLRRAAAEGGRETRVIIDPRGDVQWRWAVEAHNQALRARFVRISFQRGA